MDVWRERKYYRTGVQSFSSGLDLSSCSPVYGHSRCPKVERCNECLRTFDSSCRINH